MKTLEELMKELPVELQQEVQDFASFLFETKVHPKRSKLRMNWAGGLSEFREQFTSLELQKKALEWRGD
ncbi:MAG: DUF2281 domain-containing protein [Terriglobia bacterium]|jgi:hypothetical protein